MQLVWQRVLAVAIVIASIGGSTQTTSLVLEEVLEHGPLFDELEDEAWWSGVDVVDTALRSDAPNGSGPSSSAGSLARQDERDFCQLWHSGDSATSGFDHCLIINRALVDLSVSGGSVLLLPRLPPPPPVPPSLADLVKQLNQLSQLQQQQDGQADLYAEEEEMEDNGECLLCQWARLNGTIDLPLPNSELSGENTWVPMLIVVALVSAMLGAVLMITALKCRRLKVLPRGGSCPTLPVGYMVGEGKEGVVHTNTELHGLETLPKSYTCVRPTDVAGNGTMTSTSRPRLETPTGGGPCDLSSTTSSSNNNNNRRQKNSSPFVTEATATGWRVKLWRKMTGTDGSVDHQHQDYCQNPYISALDQASDDISAVYAELNSVAGSTVHRPSPIYHLNTYSEIREPHHHHLHHHHNGHMMPPPPTHPHQVLPATLHLRRLLSDGTYENAGYALERGVILMEHDAVSSSNCSASTPSSAYYSDLSHSDRSAGSLHQHHQGQLWIATSGCNGQRPRPRTGSESHGSSHSLPPHQHCCQQQQQQVHHHHRHEHSRSLQEQQMIRARDLMPVALQVIPDNQQVPVHHHYLAGDHQVMTFSRGGVSSSSMRDDSSGSCKRPLPPLPSRQQQRPQRRYAYAVDHQAGNESPPSAESTAGDGAEESSPALSCVPSEYV